MPNTYISKYTGVQIDDAIGRSETNESRITALELAAGFDIGENTTILNIEKDIDQLQTQLDAVRSQLAAIKSCECETTAIPRIVNLESKTASIESQITELRATLESIVERMNVAETNINNNGSQISENRGYINTNTNQLGEHTNQITDHSNQLADHATKLLPVPTTSDNYCVLQVMNGEWVLQKLRITDTRNNEYNIRASTNGKVEPVSIASSDPGITDGPGAY